MKMLIPITAGYQLDIPIDLSKNDIKKLWTVFDDKKLNYEKPKHFEGCFFEERIHDWDVRNNKLNYYSRVVEQGDKTEILVEYYPKEKCE